MVKISDSRLSQLYRGLQSEHQANPQRKVEDHDLTDLLAAVGDRRGAGFSKMHAQLEQASSLDDKLALVSEGMTASEKADLQAIYQDGQVPLSAQAKTAFEKLLGVTTPVPPQPADKQVFEVVKGRMGFLLSDDKVRFGDDGKVAGDAGVKGWARSYAAASAGPLRIRHGSSAPQSSVLSEAERQAVQDKTPGQSLNKVAELFGQQLDDFDAMAKSEDFYNPSAESWVGLCHAWSWAALSNPISKMVDVDGPEGQRGLWLGGEWLSRADLGNWMMGVSHIVSLADRDSLFDKKVTPEDLLKAVGQFMMNKGGGIVADIYNDARHGSEETWNQPFIAAEVETQTLSGMPSAKLLGQAITDGVQGGVEVKLVKATGKYVDEVSDSHEGEPAMSEKVWNLYAIVDSEGSMLKAYMADDPKLAPLFGVPVRHSDEIPDLFRRPKLQPIKDVLDGKSSWEIENNKYGEAFKFFVGTVLTQGVPATMRSDFEKALNDLPAGPIATDQAQALAQDFAQVARAYSPEQWAQHFASRGLDAQDFGATW